jgi:hypothetical protein
MKVMRFFVNHLFSNKVLTNIDLLLQHLLYCCQTYSFKLIFENYFSQIKYHIFV